MAVPWRSVSYPRALLSVLVVAVALTVFVGGVSSSTVFGAYNPAWDGASDLRGLADQQWTETVVAQNVSAYETANASSTVGVVLSPESTYSDAESGTIRQFVADGGTLVVAEDVGTASNELLAAVGADARVDGAVLRDERFNDETPEFPVADGVANHTYTQNVSQLTLNRGTAVIPDGAAVLVESSPYGYLDRNGNGELDDAEELDRRPVVAAESVGDGTVVVVGDPSIFINAMLDREDNRAFAAGLLGAHETVVVDVSHVSGVPPLVAAQLALQRSLLLQVGIGVGLVFGVVYWGRVVSVLAGIRGRVGTESPPDPELDPEAVEARVAERFPDWSAERVRRVREAIIQGKQKETRND